MDKNMKSKKNKSLQKRKKNIVQGKLLDLIRISNQTEPFDFNQLYSKIAPGLLKKLNSDELAEYMFNHLYKQSKPSTLNQSNYSENFRQGSVLSILV